MFYKLQNDFYHIVYLYIWTISDFLVLGKKVNQ
jgi:hypothetical protein